MCMLEYIVDDLALFLLHVFTDDTQNDSSIDLLVAQGPSDL